MRNHWLVLRLRILVANAHGMFVLGILGFNKTLELKLLTHHKREMISLFYLFGDNESSVYFKQC